jgi:hypothetical protein
MQFIPGIAILLAGVCIFAEQIKLAGGALFIAGLFLVFAGIR